MKKHYYKRSELVLYVYDHLINDGITVREIVENTGCCVASVYLLFEDIELYISDFYRYDIELVKIKDRFYIKKVK